MPCPGCGGTRAAIALSGLDLAGALRLNPLVTTALLAILAGAPVLAALALAGRTPLEAPVRMPAAVQVTLALLVAANWVYLLVAGR